MREERQIRVSRKLPKLKAKKCQHCGEPANVYDMHIHKTFKVNNTLPKHKRKQEIKCLTQVNFYCWWCGRMILNEETEDDI